MEREQVTALGRRRARRDAHAVDAALSALVAAARADENLVPPILDAARAEATLGEICDALRAEWGSTPRSPPSNPASPPSWPGTPLATAKG